MSVNIFTHYSKKGNSSTQQFQISFSDSNFRIQFYYRRVLSVLYVFGNFSRLSFRRTLESRGKQTAYSNAEILFFRLHRA